MAVLQKTFQDLYQEVGGFLKNDRTLSDSTDMAECKRIVNDGYLMFLAERDWTFLSPETSIVAWADTTGTVSGTPSTTVTTAAAFFHPAMIRHSVTIGTGTYTISAVASTTSATITASASSQGAAPVISITADGHYTLPSTFGELIDGFSFDTSNPYPVMVQTSPQNIRDMQSQTSDVESWPQFYALQPITYTVTTGQEWEVLMYPTPDQDYTLYYRYRVNPAQMTATNEYPIGGAKHCLTIQQACLAIAERISGKADGPQNYRYKQVNARGDVVGGLLKQSIDRDNAERPVNLGYNGDRSDLYDNNMRLERVTVIRPLDS